MSKKKGFNFESDWISIKNPIIKENLIYIDGLPNIEKYHPFDYYYNPVPDNIIDDILGNSRSNLQSIPLHVLFASLDLENDVHLIKWIYYFGMPRHIPMFKASLKLFEDKEFLSDENYNEIKSRLNCLFLSSCKSLQTDIRAFKIIINLFNEQTEKTFSPLNVKQLEDFLSKPLTTAEKNNSQAIYNSIFKKCYLDDREAETTPGELHVFNQIDGISNFAEFNFKSNITNGTICRFLDTFLDKVTPSLNFSNNKHSIDWKFDELLSALYFMLALDINTNNLPQQCANKLCKTYFIPKKTGALYCSDTCQNRAKQHRYRAKLKNPKEGE